MSNKTFHNFECVNDWCLIFGLDMQAKKPKLSNKINVKRSIAEINWVF